MKIFKISLILALIVLAQASFNNGIAQTFSNNDKGNGLSVSSRQRLVVDLLRAELAQNPAFKGYADAINYQLDFASEQDVIAPDCYKYTPLLVNALNKNQKFSSFYNLQDTFGYTFENRYKESVSYSFYTFFPTPEKSEISSSVKINKGDYSDHLGQEEAVRYVINNFCTPFNQLLDKHSKLAVPQLLNVLRQTLSR